MINNIDRGNNGIKDTLNYSSAFLNNYISFQVFKILTEHNCNVDYSSVASDLSQECCLPDAFIASLTSDPLTISVMLPYSLHCEPDYLLSFDTGVLNRMPLQVRITFNQYCHDLGRLPQITIYF